jgi:hypothetical protein
MIPWFCPQVHLIGPTEEEVQRRHAWLAEKEALRQKRMMAEQARREREAAAIQAALEAKAQAHRKAVEERKAKYVSTPEAVDKGPSM